MRMKFLSVIFVMLFCFAVNSQAEISNRVVVIVNKDVITLYELNNRVKDLTGKTSEEIKEQDEASFIEVRRQVIEKMINEKLEQEKIQEFGMQVSEERVDSYIESIKKSNNWTQEDLIAALKERGLTLESFREQQKKEMEEQSLVQYEVEEKSVILESEVLKYYQEHKNDFKEEEHVQIAGIFLMVKDENNKDELNELTKKGEEILSRLKKGEDFGTLAKEFSQGPGIDEGGALGELNTAEIDPEWKKVIDGLSDGDVSNVLTKATGIQIIKLIKRNGGAIKPFEEVKNDIYKIISNEELNKRYTTWLKELRDKSYIKINF